MTRNGQPFVLGTPHPDFNYSGLRVTFGEWCRGGFFAGCNRHSWLWTIVDGRLRIDDSGATIVGCTTANLEQDEWLDSFFRSSPRIRLQGATLTIVGADIEIVLTEESPEDRR